MEEKRGKHEGRLDRNILAMWYEPSWESVCVEPSVVAVFVRSGWDIWDLDAFERRVRRGTAGQTEGFLSADWTETVS